MYKFHSLHFTELKHGALRTKMNMTVIPIFILLTILGDFINCVNVEAQCKKKCRSFAQQVTDETDLRCDVSCQVALCENGCDLWRQGLQSSCQKVCISNVSLQYREQHCRTGCNLAVDINTQAVKGEINKLIKPTLVRGSKTNTSVTLQWQRAGSLPDNVTLLLQQRKKGSSKGWQYHQDVQWLDTGQIRITGLRPYQNYRFRVVLSVTSEVSIKSPSSGTIRTLPYGAPSSPPRVLSISRLPTAIHLKWRSPTQINAPLTRYEVLISSPDSSKLPRSKYIRYTGNITTETIAWLTPGTRYVVRIYACNRYGIGPAILRKVKTPPYAESKKGGIPVLIVGAGNMVLQKNVTELFDSLAVPDTTYSTENMSILVNGSAIVHSGQVKLVKGVSFHFRKHLLFVSDSSGLVQCLTMTQRGTTKAVIYNSTAHPTFLSVDWLHDHLYILERSKVTRCNLDDNICQTALFARGGNIENIQVDPYNGYFFWTQRGSRQGLNRVDLAKVQSDEPYIASKSDVLIRSDRIAPFTLDYQNYRLYYPDGRRNTMMSVNLDGSEIKNIRNNTLNPAFTGVRSLVHHAGLFYWSNGASMLQEEFEAGPNVYHHNDVFFYEQNGHFSQVNIWHPSAQPVPVPLTSPTNVQILFGVDSALMSWQAPRHDAGAGAWQDWLYELSIKGHNVTYDHVRNLNKTMCRLYKLKHATRYEIRVRGYSENGAGPWSDAFTGQTLQSDKSVPYFLVTNGKVIYRSPLDGTDTMAVLTNPVPSGYIIDIHFMIDTYYMVTNVGHIYKRQKGKPTVRYPHISNADVMDIDWLANRIYWSNNRQGMIYRSDVAGVSMETVYASSAYSLAVDAISGYLFWTTMHTVQCARLNGEQHMQIMTLPLLSGRIALGLTLDLAEAFVYWIVNENGRATLYRARLTPGAPSCVGGVTKVGSWKRVSRTPLLHCFSSKLMWLNQNSLLTVSDTRGRNQASVHFRQTALAGQLRSFTVVHHLIYPYPAGLDRDTIQVIPKAVNISSLNVTGNASSFYITWGPTTVNHGQVRYEIKLTYDGKQEVKDVAVPGVLMMGLHPYTFIALALRAYTVWGKAPVVHANVSSPMSTPGVPSRPRVFTTQQKEGFDSEIYVEVDFRWSPPKHPNGNITNYWVRHREDHSPDWILKDRQTNTFFSVGSVRAGNLYHFQVWACSAAGCGNRTEVVTANTSVIEPRPSILTSRGGSIKLTDPDINRTTYLAKGHATAVTNLEYDDAIFWMDTSHRVMRIRNDGVKELTKVNGTCNSMAIDWLGRTLYWSEGRQHDKNAIVRYDLDNNKPRAVDVIRRLNVIGTVAVDPFHSKLYWIELLHPFSGRLMMADLRSKNDIKPVIEAANGSKRNKRQVDCERPALSLAPVFVMDHSLASEAKLYLVENSTGDIWRCSANGCHCHMVVNASTLQHSGLPPDSMTVDQHQLYWTNNAQAVQNSVDKSTGHVIQTRSVKDPGLLLAMGSHLQPYPDKLCLIPEDYTETPDFASHTNSSITLNLMPIEIPPQCSQVTMAAVKYTVHYRPLMDDDDRIECTNPNVHCDTMVTYNGTHTVTDLEPYQEYLFQVSVSNFYMEQKKMVPKMGPATFYSTKEGVPGPAQNVTAQPVSPEMIEIKWWLPLEPNGKPEDLVYKIEWRTWDEKHIQSQGVVLAYKAVSQTFFASIKNLRSEQRYWFTVLTYGKSEIGPSRTVEISAVTYQYPGPILLSASTCESLQVAWTSPTDNSITRHTLQYKEVTDMLWRPVSRSLLPQLTKNATEYEATLDNLKPNTEYAFRVGVIYKPQRFFSWPKDLRYTYKTAAGVPGIVISPVVRQRANNLYEVYWKKPDDYGAQITNYHLQMRSDSVMNWTVVYNGSDSIWTISDLPTGEMYIFRVAAHNLIGWSNYSGNSTPFLLPTIAKAKLKLEHENLRTTALGISFTVVIIMIVTAIVVILIVNRRRRAEKNLQLEFINGLRAHRQDVELATLRELPHISIQQNNALYAINIIPTDEDVAALPHFSRDQLQLTKFLGSGAFGEVFEGIANNIITDASGETKVAVKTLHKGATDQEKEEFLKEALLMSHFKHAHILRLLGVCLHNDPQFIILELMQGGDLLSYLRASRHTQVSPPGISIADMTSICIDVARGCVYLEEMHFVHRDIAARNCLVSSINPEDRIVKMGDFGLARDIYKNDYYRKEGEGLLPVRWMSPESLIDGVFTTQSDVWAFGVLMWEVQTLGQQPYPARTNIEVLHFVRSGGRLDRPDNCPDDLYHLMLKCWSYSAEDRPSFSYILEQLERFQRRVSQTGNDVTPNSNETEVGGIDNMAFDAVESPLGMSTVNLESMKVLGGSMRLTPTSKKRRLHNLLGLAVEDADEDGRDTVLENPNTQSKNGLCVPGSVKRAVSFDIKALHRMAKSDHQRETPVHGSYLEPQNAGNRPQYLELLNDPTPYSISVEDYDGRIIGEDQSNIPSLNYAELAAGDGDYDNAERDHVTESVSKSSSQHQQQPTELNYTAIATSDNQCDSDTDVSAEVSPNGHRIRRSSTGIHYAQLASMDSNPDMDTDNEAIEEPTPTISECGCIGGHVRYVGPKSSLKPKPTMTADDDLTSAVESAYHGEQDPVSSPLLRGQTTTSNGLHQRSPKVTPDSTPRSRRKESPRESKKGLDRRRYDPISDCYTTTVADQSSRSRKRSPGVLKMCSENAALSNGVYAQPSTAESSC